ncbi:MAG TPA: hypothetical protein VFB52_10110 [Solirubrobacterales bacterium]|nr:hypothetical protein [Solirubrobacterales bacterium]
MKLHLKFAMVLGALVLAMAPALALAAPSQTGQENGNGPKYAPEKPDKPETPGPKDPLPEQAKAYGVYCKGESKKHVKGEKGTDFSRCVNAMAKAAQSEKKTAREACKGLSKKHVKGEKGTAYSRCVSAAAKLKKDQREAANA